MKDFKYASRGFRIALAFTLKYTVIFSLFTLIVYTASYWIGRMAWPLFYKANCINPMEFYYKSGSCFHASEMSGDFFGFGFFILFFSSVFLILAILFLIEVYKALVKIGKNTK
ncbi:hypothetical protein ACG2K1_02230 [Neisseria sp. 23W00296]|uniref:hypothetical protein n=1 Tax=unclassified Neisseria TaxID=2623750 RepID=UPI00375646F2